jgi:hypothetical protein
MRLARPIRRYHGSSDPNWLSRIETCQAQLLPREEVGLLVGRDHMFQPLPDRVYVTADEEKAVMIADGQAVLWVEIPAGADVLPDEDCVAEVLGRYLGFQMPELCAYAASKEVAQDRDLQQAVGSMIPSATAQQLRNELEPLVHKDRWIPGWNGHEALVVLLPVAKELVYALDDATVERFVRHGVDLAVAPPVKIIGAWYGAYEDLETAEGFVPACEPLFPVEQLKTRLLR